MIVRVPFVSEESIESNANALLAQFARARHTEIKAPIPIEDIVEKHLKLQVEFDDLHHLFGLQRGAEPDIFGAIWLETGEIIIDESLDPEEDPSMEGRYRFTLAHEGGGHWRLHRPFVMANRTEGSFVGHKRRPNIICRPSQSKERVEWQADFYASCLLMPRKLIMQAWHDRFGNLRPFVSNWERACWLSPGLRSRWSTGDRTECAPSRRYRFPGHREAVCPPIPSFRPGNAHPTGKNRTVASGGIAALARKQHADITLLGGEKCLKRLST